MNSRPGSRYPSALVRWVCLCVFLLPLVSGCDGCRREPTDQEKTAAEELKKPPFTFDAAKACPSSRPDVSTQGAPDGSVKPGHWTSVRLSLRSNRDDQRGRIITRAKSRAASSSQFVTGESPGMPLSEDVAVASDLTGMIDDDSEANDESIDVIRPANLPKGSRRRLDTRVLAPTRGWKLVDSIFFDGFFESGDAAVRMPLMPSRFKALQPQTYFFVILTDRPDRFARLQVADWAKPYQSEFAFYRSQDNYRIVIPPTQGVLPLSETVLDWTSTAVVLWDDLPSTALTPSQRTALLDWVHFGGTLILNGSAASEAMTTKELAPLFPLRGDGNEELPVDSMASLVKSMAVQTDASVDAVVAKLQDGASRVSLAGNEVPGAIAIGEGEMLWQHLIGRGRVVQSRMDLMSDWLTDWESYDSFFNSAVLNRPPRVYRSEPNQPGFVVDGEDKNGLPPMQQTLVGMQGNRVQPILNSRFYWLARDGRLPATIDPTDVEFDEASVVKKTATSEDKPPKNVTPWLNRNVVTHPVSGIGGWKEDSPFFTIAMQTLRGEIGVKIPDSSLVIRSLAIYLAILIPLNYLVFRLLGRLEWAWLAIVPMALFGAYFVAKAAELDVGLARSRNEIAMLEIPRGYQRGHLSRAIGLYNSLASQYRLTFDDLHAAATVIQPSGDRPSETNFFGNEAVSMRLGYELGPTFEGISVGSNSFTTLHTEQMIDVGGVIGLAVDAERLTNDSAMDLQAVRFVERLDDGSVRTARVGQLTSGETSTVNFSNDAGLTAESMAVPEPVSELYDRLANPNGLSPGEARLVAWVDQPLDGLKLIPECRQVQAQTLVVVHLKDSLPPTPYPDQNLLSDFRRKRTELEPAQPTANETTSSSEAQPEPKR